MPIAIDIKSQSLAPNCVVLQVGFVKFDLLPDKIALGRSAFFYFNADLQVYNLNSDRDQGTIDWWLDKNAELYREILAAGKTQVQFTQFQQTVHLFAKTLSEMLSNPKEEIWARGPQFDIVALKNLLTQLAIPIPWNHSSVRDSRTLYAIAKTNNFVEPPWDTGLHGQQHDALNDACKEAEDIQLAFQCLKLP